MATVTLTIQSLINTAVYDSYTLDNTTTIANVKAVIQSNTSVDSTWYQLVYSNDLMSNTSATLADYGIVSNVTLRSANKIGRLSTLEDRQRGKLNLSSLDRIADSNPRSVYDITELPTQYSGNTVVDNPNPGGLIEGRPWVVGAVAAPVSIEGSVSSSALVDLQVWYDGADSDSFIPTPSDESSITQWTDKSAFAHNANPTSGIQKPTYESSNPLNGLSYVEFDGTQAFSVNPVAWAQGLAGFTAFVVARPNSEVNGDTIMTTNTGDFKISRNSTTWTVGMNTGTAIPTSNVNSLNTWGIFTLVYDAANPLVFRFNRSGVALGAYTPPATSSGSNSTLYIGHDGSSTAYTGGIAEIVLFSRALSSIEYSNVENYLYSKWLAP